MKNYFSFFKILVTFSSFFLINIFSSYSSNINNKKFKPYMLFHPIEGCPTNSNCTKKAASLRKKWIHLVHLESLSTKKKRSKPLKNLKGSLGFSYKFGQAL